MEMDLKFWQDRRVFVTGATGLLGSWLTRKLVDLGADVVVLIRDWVPASELNQSGYLSRSTIVGGDLIDQALLERILNEYEIETVFHTAAQTIVGTANRSPISTFESNIKGTWSLLEAARLSSLVKQIIVASSDKAYGSHDKLPYHEDAPLQGRHPYDVSKSCADLISQSYAHSFDLPVCITRCGNLFGGGDLNWNRLIPGTIRSVIRNENPIIRSDGMYIRDYFYVEDAALAYVKLAEHMASDPAIIGRAYNYSNEIQLSVSELTNMILRLMKREDLTPTILNQANNEIQHQYLSAERSHRELGWQPDFTLEDGLKRTIGWYQSYFGVKTASNVEISI
jgi:CDP-glucose 4,6-dehydratase